MAKKYLVNDMCAFDSVSVNIPRAYKDNISYKD